MFVNSHLLSELELISNRVAIMTQGQVVRQGTMSELAAHRIWYELNITPESAGPVADVLAAVHRDGSPVLHGQLADGAWVEVEQRREGTTVRVGTHDAANVQGTLDRPAAGTMHHPRHRPGAAVAGRPVHGGR